MTFLDDARDVHDVDKLNELIDDEVEVWHTSTSSLSLREHLGMSSDQYKRWVEKPGSIYDIVHKEIFDEEKRQVLAAWRTVSLPWRLFLVLTPRACWRPWMKVFFRITPSYRSRGFWFLIEKIFCNRCRMIRFGDGAWEDVQKYLRHCLLYER